MSPLTTDDLVNILQCVLTEFRENVDPEIGASKILCLTVPYLNPGMHQMDVAEHVPQLSTSAISRHVMDWSEYDKHGKPGLSFINQRPDPAFRRRNLLYLAPRGQQFLQGVTAQVNKRLEKLGRFAAED